MTAEALPSQNKDFFDYAADYLKTADGPYNFFKTAAHAARWAQRMPLRPGQRVWVDAAETTFGAATNAMFVPATFAESNDFRRNVTSLQAAKALADTDPQKKEKVKEAYKKTIVGGIGSVGTLLDGAFFLSSAKLLPAALETSPLANVIYNSAYLISDGSDLVDQVKEIQECDKAIGSAKSAPEKHYYESKKSMANAKTIRDIMSIGMSVIGILGVFFLAFSEGTAIAGLMLMLSTGYLVTNVMSYFIEKMKVDEAKAKLDPFLLKA